MFKFKTRRAISQLHTVDRKDVADRCRLTRNVMSTGGFATDMQGNPFELFTVKHHDERGDSMPINLIIKLLIKIQLCIK